MSRGRLIGALVVAALAAPGAAAAGLVLGAREAPGLKPARATAAGGRRALAAALAPARLPAQRGKPQASHFRRKGVELWSLAYVLTTPKAAGKQLDALSADLKRSKFQRRRSPIGNEGFTVASKRGKRAAVVLWRRGNTVGEIVLTAGLGPATLRRFALGYAGVVDFRMEHALSLDAWQRTLNQIKPNGAVPRKTALDLFALAYAPLPGTRRPAGPRGRHEEGTMAARLVLRLWPTLSSAQRRAAMQALGITGVSFGKTRSARSVFWPLGRADYGDPAFKVDPKVQTLADKYVPIIGGKLGVTLKLKVIAGTTTDNSDADADADATAVDQNGLISNAAPFCRIRILPHGQTIADADIYEENIVHEVFHCFQFQIMTPVGALKVNKRDWLLEGTAEWAALTIRPVSWNQRGDHLEEYLETPEKELFSRTYDAAGFFGHAEESTGDLWTRMVGILKAATSPKNHLASGGDLPAFLNSWGASTFNVPLGSTDWAMKKPLPPPDGYRPPAVPVWSSGGGVKAAAYTYARYRIDKTPGPPLLHVQIERQARLANPTLDTTALKDVWFCLEERCECPEGTEGTPPPAPPLGAAVTHLALSGGSKGTSGLLTRVSLETYCKKKQKPPPPPPGGPPIGGGGGSGCKGGCGGSNGDPHLHTFDNRFYDFQGAGEYTLVRSTTGDLEVQAREGPYPGSRTLAINTAIAMRVAGDRVAVYTGFPLVVRVNGLALVPGKRTKALPHGGRIRLVQGEIEVIWPDGSLARVWSVSSWGVATLVRPAKARFGALRGLLGNFDGNPGNDFLTRKGRKLDPDRVLGSGAAGYRLLYRVFGDSWRIAQGRSLFDYARGQSTRSFTNRRFPARIVAGSDLPASARRAAERICRRLGIRNPTVLRDCILDVAGTGDGRFATAGRQLERRAGRFGKPTRPKGPTTGVGQARWTVVSTGGTSNGIVPSLALDGEKVVMATLVGSKAAEAVTFTPSTTADVQGLRRDPITAGWSILDNPVLLPRAGGGLQVLYSGLGAPSGAQNGTSTAPRNPDGTFGPPVLAASASNAEVGGAAVLAPDGQPIWAATYAGALSVSHGSTGATTSDLRDLVNGYDYVPSVGRDGRGRYWLAWYALGNRPTPSGLYVVQIDPSSLQPVGGATLVPGSGTVENGSLRIPLACAQRCRIVYQQAGGRFDRIVSWAPGEKKAAIVVAKASPQPWITAAYGSDGRLWVAWYDQTDNRYHALRGNAAGAGGKVVVLGQPTAGSGFALSGIVAGKNLVLVANAAARQVFSRYVNVVAPPG